MAEKLRINDNGFRASKVLLDGGGYLSKQLLLQKAIKGTITTIDEFLADTGTTRKINKLKQKGLINTSQNEILFRINGTSTNLENWDITLTTLILNNCFKLSQTEKQFIDDLRTHRNTLYGHTSKVEMTDADFGNNWSSISATLTLHSALLTNVSCRTHLQDTITSISKETLSADKTIDTLRRWYEWGIEVEQKLGDIKEDQQTKFDNSEKKADERFDATELRFDASEKKASERFDATELRFEASEKKATERFDATELRFEASDKKGSERFDATELRFDASEKRASERFDATELRFEASDKKAAERFVATELRFEASEKKASERFVATELRFKASEEKAAERFVATELRFETSEKKASERFDVSEKGNRELRENMLRLETDICSLKNRNEGDEIKTVDKIKLNRQIAKARNNLQVHGNELKKLNIPYKTSLTEESTLKLKHNKIVVLKGIPGAGKTHLAKNIMMHFLFLYPNLKPLIMRSPRTIEEVLDPNGSFILLVDNFVGKVAFDAMDMKDWQTYIDDFVSQIAVSELYVIITVRTAMVVQIDPSFMSNLLKKNNIVDIDETLSFEEKSELITVYATSANITISQDQNDKIVAQKCAGVGFPLLCKMMTGQNVDKIFERPIDCIKIEIKEMQTSNPCCYVVLFLTLMQEKNILSKNGLAPEQTECFKTLQNYFESSNMDINCIYRAAVSLERTYLQFNNKDFHFEFIHEAIAHSTFLVALEMMPKILAKYCQTEILISNINLVWEIKDKEYDEHERNLIGKTCKEIVITKVKGMLSSENANLETKCIANARMWDDESFIDEVMLLFNIDFFYQCNNKGNSLLSYFASIANKIALETVIEITYSYHQSTFKTEQIHVALINACLSGETECVKYILSKVLKLTEEAVFAAVRGCVLEIIESVTSQFGVDKIDSITEKDTGCTILHVASATGNVEIVLYICTTWPAIINKVDDNEQTAMHYAQAKGKIECLKILGEQGINARSKNKYGNTILHRAALNGNLPVVQFICATYQELINEKDKHGSNAAQCAAVNGTVECLKFIIDQGIDSSDKNDIGGTILHIAACFGNINVVHFICQTYQDLIHLKDKHGRNAAHSAAENGTVECLKFLIEQGLDPRDKYINGGTILHRATINGNITVVQFICQTYQDLIDIKDDYGKNAAHHAAVKGTVQCLKFLIEQGIDPRDKSTDGDTILHLAAKNGNITVLKYICQTYQDLIHIKDNFGRYAAHYAAENGTVECLRFLIEQGIDPRDRSSAGDTILHRAAKNGNITVVKYICQTYQDLIDIKDDYGKNAAHDAAKKGTVECLKFLIEQGIDRRDKTDIGGTILHKAANFGNINVVHFICQTYQDLIHLKDKHGRNAAHTAAENGTVECLKFLIEQGLDPRDKYINGGTILHRAAINGNITVVQFICQTYQDLIDIKDDYGKNAAHHAAEKGTVQCLKYLIEQGIDPRDKSTDGDTILHLAANNGNITVLKYICQTYQDLIHIKDNFGRYAAHYAAANGTVECLRFLIEQGIDPRDRSSAGDTILHRAAKNGNITVVKYICQTYQDLIDIKDDYGKNAAHHAAEKGTVECLKFLIEQGIDPKDRSTDGETILHLAAYNGNITVVQFICQNYQDLIHIKDDDGRSAAHYAAEKGTVECLKFLIEKGINPRDRSTDGPTILHRAALGGNITVVKYICQTYQDLIHIKDYFGRCAAHYAAEKGTVECLKFLIEQGINPRDKDTGGDTILHRAAYNGDITVVQFICQNYQELINKKNEYGRNAAHYAAANGTVECLKFLLEQGINPKDKANNGETILHCAARDENIAVVKFICQTYQNLIHKKNYDYNNAASIASKKGSVECLEFLQSQGVTPNCCSLS